MMQILLCAATSFEIQPALEWIRNDKKSIDVLVTGVGLTAATYYLTRHILLKKPSIIVQAGIAGSLDDQLSLGETVIVEHEFIGDLGVMERDQFKDLFQLGFTEQNNFPYQQGKLTNTYIPTLDVGHFKRVTGVSVNEISTNIVRIAHYKKLGAQIESMEGAAVHYTALMESIPFLQLRSVSNYVGERDKSKWILKEAITVLNNELIRLLDKLSS